MKEDRTVGRPYNVQITVKWSKGRAHIFKCQVPRVEGVRTPTLSDYNVGQTHIQYR